MLFFGKTLAGAGYIVLNIIRVMNIIALLAVIAASSVMLVKTFIVSKFFFFDACEHVLRVIMSGFLILTELSLFKSYFSKNWPLFSARSSFVMLGAAMIFLGNSLLGNLNKHATSQESLGLPFWRLVIAAGIIVFVMGFINLFASYIFRDTKAHLTARQVRSHGAVASHKADVEASTPKPPSRKSHYRSFFLGKRDSLPSYYSRKNTERSNMAETPKMHLAISSPFPQDQSLARTAQSPGAASSKYSQSPKSERYAMSPELSRPDLAHHPAMTQGHAV
ncbi:uncharacterized protein Z519_01889 [Cladophialophora bantiana CBS 173.52]|uniref:DUF7598 domain-containing protein n=1 Tax=Cladophialophora bantiana (strain ATCC 10958 / CBS 173.52 / CDC B-1940 / NIH 8579) TaxID=1442370 RepID=A0A0D2I4V2_CLAB1|nr:uncharacterized protein Z519_01889 [Cladophialophora bantiana CBS 173.52]KIW98305.1 hypothetical protein Z519_01889 [Cladophialophora bantiana CBS 173.52]